MSAVMFPVKVPYSITDALDKAGLAGCRCKKSWGRHKGGRDVPLTADQMGSLVKCTEATIESTAKPNADLRATANEVHRIAKAAIEAPHLPRQIRQDLRIAVGYNVADEQGASWQPSNLPDRDASAAQRASSTAPARPSPCGICGSTEVVWKKAAKLAKVMLFTPGLLMPRKPHCAGCGAVRQA